MSNHKTQQTLPGSPMEPRHDKSSKPEADGSKRKLRKFLAQWLHKIANKVDGPVKIRSGMVE